MIRCPTCSTEFNHHPLLIALLEKIGPVSNGSITRFPLPADCPDCRRQRRHSFHNERNLYRRHCDSTGRDIVSVFSPGSPRVVFHPEAWISDQYDPYDFGREYDFSRTFFDQFEELLRVVPRRSVNIINSENCEFNNNIWRSKNCYLVFCTSIAVDCAYVTNCYKMTNTLDAFLCDELELCHDIFRGRSLYECFSCRSCRTSQRLLFCEGCSDCADCVGCYHIQQRQFCIFNEQYSEREYRALLADLELGSHISREYFSQRVKQYFNSQPHKNVWIDAVSENCSGDLVTKSKNILFAFSSGNSDEGIYLFETARNTSVADLDYTYEATLTYQTTGMSEFYNCAFLVDSDACKDSFYSYGCFNSQHLFGCVGMKRGEYSILNKRYSPEAYQALLAKIVTSMKDNHEWGEFFPAELSDFGYNETDAMIHTPLTRETALRERWRWNDYEPPAPQARRVLKASDLPDHLRDTTDAILDSAILCQSSGKPYRILPQELAFYRKYTIPIPRQHPNERHVRRLGYRNPLCLRLCNCSRCGSEIQTTFPESSPVSVVCDPCFRKLYGL